MTGTDAKNDWSARMWADLSRPIDGASLAAFRIVFGGLMLVAVIRFFAHGWIDAYFVAPRVFFHHAGLSWIRPWPAMGMTVHFAAMGLCALLVMLGLFYRTSVVLFGLLFAYVHLIDKTNYLNHHYLIICLAFLMACVPAARVASVDAWRRRGTGHLPGAQLPLVPAWSLWALRAQVGLVYIFGGVAKLGSDWLIDAQPMAIWLSANTDFPVVGRAFDEMWVARAFAIAGAAFDLSIVGLLLWRRSRHLAFFAVLVFHLLTARLFQLGMFPFVMLGASLLFLDADWPRQLWRRVMARGQSTAKSTGQAADAGHGGPRWPDHSAPMVPGRHHRIVVPLLGLHFILQLLLPLRHWAFPGNTLWTEQGFRYAWKVMVMEKNGSAEFHVREPATGRRWSISPARYLTPYQAKMMATQPDMILQFAQMVADDFRAQGVRDPEVRADVFASLNGRPRARLVNGDVDLVRERDGFGPRPWIVPLTEGLEDKALLAKREQRP